MEKKNSEILLKEIENWKLKSFLETKEIWNKIISTPDSSISRDEILKIIGCDKSDLDISQNKLVERTINKFRFLFDFSSEQFYYHRTKKRYVLNSTSNYNYNPIFNYLYNYLTALKLSNEIKENQLTLFSETIKFHFRNTRNNVPQIFVLMKAIQQEKQIKFKHHNFFNNELSTHFVEPWFIKPDGEKFYVGGFRLKKNDAQAEGYRHFTVSQIIADSIEILDITIDKKRKAKMFNELEFSLFNQCLGVRIFKEDQPEEKYLNNTIKVETNFTVGKEWLNNPIHINQKCIKEAKDLNDTFLFQFENFYFNNTFMQLILGLGSSVKVLEPKEAQEEIRKELLNAFQKYNLPNFRTIPIHSVVENKIVLRNIKIKTEKDLLEKIEQLKMEKELDVKNQNHTTAAHKRDLIKIYTNQLEELRKNNPLQP